MKSALILGGNGSIGRLVGKHLIGRGYHVTAADIRSSTGSVMTNDVFLDIRDDSSLSRVFQQSQPNVVINAINTATIFSEKSGLGYSSLIRFYSRLFSELSNIKHPVHYVNIGTTGTGGLGSNVPFTHGESIEDLPLIHKAAFAGIGTALLLLFSRSFTNGTRISELKPGLAIFNKDAIKVDFAGQEIILADGGENGKYSYDELAILTKIMGFTTAEKIADRVMKVLDGLVTRHDICSFDTIDALNHSIISQEESDKALLEQLLLQLKSRNEVQLITSGSLGPPSLSLLLFFGYISTRIKPSNRDTFHAALRDDNLLLTMNYIRKNDAAQAQFISKGLVYDKYQELASYYLGCDEAWQVAYNIQLSTGSFKP